MENSKDLPSKRKFVVAFIEGDAAVTQFPTLAEILTEKNGNDWEWKYAIQDKFDELLDLKVGDRLLMNFNRDNADSAGYIKRTI